MRLVGILDRDKRAKHIAILRKRAARLVRAPVDSVPVFLFGLQRSGTTMTMEVFHHRRDTEVFDERARNRAFLDYRIRSLGVVEALTTGSKAPFVCFKPLADSHLIHEFSARFPSARMLWIYRHHADNARSALRTFAHATRAIRLVCTGRSGGGWFQEGVSADTAEVLREAYTPDMSALDLACLVWWARNRLVVELGLMDEPRVLIVRYEDLVAEHHEGFAELFRFIGMSHDASAVARVVRRTATDPIPPNLDPRVQELCQDLQSRLDAHVATRTRVSEAL